MVLNFYSCMPTVIHRSVTDRCLTFLQTTFTPPPWFSALFGKIAKKRDAGYYNILYNLHKAGPALATIVAFYHGLTIIPWTQNYVWTGWLLGIVMILLVAIGVIMGFKTEWVPYNDEQDQEFKGIRVVKWLLTLFLIVGVAIHYLYV